MPKEFTLQLTGAAEVIKALQALGQQAGPAMHEALWVEGTELMKASKELCPVASGKLIESATIVSEKEGPSPAISVGYGGAAVPYALSVHENPRAGRTGGVSPSGRLYPLWRNGKPTWSVVGQWKYLETPFKERTAGFTARIANLLRASLLKGG